MQENKRKILRAAVIVIVSFLFIKLIMSFKQDNNINQLTESKKLVSTQVVTLSNNEILIPVSGKLQSVNQVNIICEANGIFYGKKFKTGIKFSKGDTLGHIKYDEVESNLKSQKSNLLNQVSRLVSEIKFDYPDSYNTWLEFMNNIQFNQPLPTLPEINDKKFKNYLSGKNFFNTYYTVKGIQERLRKHLIISEFDGILSDVNIKSGSAVVFGQNIGRYQDPSILEFESSTNIKNTLLIKKNQDVILESDELTGIWNGSVSRINKTINSSSQNMSVFIETSDKSLYSGMYVFGNIIAGDASETFSITRNLIKNNKIFLVIKNKLVSKEIEIIQINEENAIIKGLINGDVILGEPIKESYPGMQVRTQKK